VHIIRVTPEITPTSFPPANRGGNGMTEVLWVMLGLGGLLGFFVGRWSAETRRARFDMDRTWQGRKGYRDR
jgi:hypothetical protein